MSFSAVSLGHTVVHGDFLDFLDLLFKEIKVNEENNIVTVELHPFPDVLINGVSQATVIKGEKAGDDWKDSDDIYMLLNDNTKYTIEYKGSMYPLGNSHNCSYGIILAAIGDGCSDDPKEFSIDEIQKFCNFLHDMQKTGRLQSTKVFMIGNCCS